MPRQAGLSIVVALAATIPLFASAYGQDDPSQEPIVVDIQAFQFASAVPSVSAGDTVVWINRDIVPHTATASDGSWDSGEIKPGESWQMIVGEGMTLDYYCAFHPVMVATLSVTAD